jgi:hypothetical protein
MFEERGGGNTPASEGTPRWIVVAFAVLTAISLVGGGIAWSASRRAAQNEQALGNEVQALRKTLDVLGQRLENAEESAAQAQGELAVVTDRLQLTQSELNRARQQARQIREDYAKQLAAVENSVKSELATKADTQAVEALGGEVNSVRGELETTRQHLQMARGELGTLIARNSEEIEQLRRLGLRDYYEFTLDGKGSRQKIGDIVVELRGTNTKKNHFTVALYVDDLRLEKKNRSINEPIYFYTRGTRAPLELVVNEVGKNKAVGYLSVPKSAPIRASGS